MKILNLGCGTKVSAIPDVINIDWSIYLRIRSNRLLRAVAPVFVRGQRLAQLNSIPDNIMVYDLSKGIPFEANSVDVVYHSHLLEHLDRKAAKQFLLEVKRVLKEGGVQRIVVPDFEKLCRTYIAHIALCEQNPEEVGNHDNILGTIIEQSVRKESYGTSQQKCLRKFVENVVFGDARKRGETHQWMYDRVSLCALLTSLGYRNCLIRQFNSSAISDWSRYGLEVDEFGREYKKGSLYVEALK